MLEQVWIEQNWMVLLTHKIDCLCFSGPGVNNAVLLQIQEKKAKEMELNSKATYDNVSFEKSNDEIPVETSCPVKADIVSNTTQAPTQLDVAIL